MSLAAPLALGLGLLAMPLVLLYLLKPRREELVVSSTFLWQQALEEVQANAPWQKLRRNLLLLLQLLILALLVLALARPLLRSDVAPGGDLVLVLDTSASMAATDLTPSRFDQAKDRVTEIARNAGLGSRVALLTAGPTPRLLAGPTMDQAAVSRALNELRTPHGEANLRDATILARSVAGRLKDPTILLVGDGGPVAIPPPSVPYPVRFDAVHGAGTNAGILGLATREGAGGRQLWASVGNYGPARTATLSLSVDGRLVDARTLQLPADGSTGVEVNDLPQGAVVQAKLDAKDALASDDVAWHVNARAAPTRVLLYGAESRFLERALALLPNVDVFKAKPGTTVEAGYDVYIISGPLPAQLPPTGNLVLLGPTNSTLLPVIGTLKGLTVTSQNTDNLLLRFVDLRSTSVATASRLAPPDWMETLAASGDVPLLVAGETEGRKVVALAFTPENSDLPLQVAFPVLVDNLLRHLQPPSVAGVGSYQPGETVQLPVAASQRTVVAPDGRRSTLEPRTAVFASTVVPGVYEVHGDGDKILTRFAVNTGSANESRITARDGASLTTSGSSAAGAPPQAPGSDRWWPLAAFALVVLLVEWWLYGRTQTRGVPGRRSVA